MAKKTRAPPWLMLTTLLVSIYLLRPEQPQTPSDQKTLRLLIIATVVVLVVLILATIDAPEYIGAFLEPWLGTPWQ